MWFSKTAILLLGAVALAASATAQTAQAPSAITRTVVAATKLPTVTDVPLHFRAVGITLASGEKSAALSANGILYQISGSTEISVGGEIKMLSSGEALFIAAGKTATLKAGKEGPSTLPPLLSCPGRRPGSTCRDSTRRLEGIISHSGTDSRPEAGQL
jgi:quercetin dioxygenase-like cupin family protein